MFFRLQAEVLYFEQPPTIESNGRTAILLDNDVPFGVIKVALLGKLALEVDPDDVTPENAGELIDTNIIFMMFPYLRTTIQQTAADLRRPPTVLPYLHRDIDAQLHEEGEQ